MAFFIKDTEVQLSKKSILENGDGYTAFPNAESATFDPDVLIPVGLLSGKNLKDQVEEDILIALPNIQGTFDGEWPWITYSLTDKGWVLDEEYLEASEDKIEDSYVEYYNKAKAFFEENKFLSDNLKNENPNKDNQEKASLFELGGQPPLGQNWDSMMFDEMGDNPELDNYHEVMDEGEDEEVEHMSTREITYFDEEFEKEFIYLGLFSYDIYVDGGGECIVFYQPELKKVMVVAEFS